MWTIPREKGKSGQTGTDIPTTGYASPMISATGTDQEDINSALGTPEGEKTGILTFFIDDMFRELSEELYRSLIRWQ
jgi:hypothetical protein